jgi:LacI family transcriptional regulator
LLVHHHASRRGHHEALRVASHAVRQLLERNDRPDAILAFNDIIAFAAYTTILQMGLRIPEDVAIIGFTDDVHAEYVTPRLSAIVDQSTLMGRPACRLPLRHISGDLKVTHEIVPQKLMIRDTSDKNKAQ